MKSEEVKNSAHFRERNFLNYNAIFDTGCKRLQSCIEMQPEMGMQPSNKREFI